MKNKNTSNRDVRIVMKVIFSEKGNICISWIFFRIFSFKYKGADFILHGEIYFTELQKYLRIVKLSMKINKIFTEKG